MDAPSGQCRAPPSSPVPRVPSLARSEPGGRRRHVARGPLMVYERRLSTPLLSPFLCSLRPAEILEPDACGTYHLPPRSLLAGWRATLVARFVHNASKLKQFSVSAELRAPTESESGWLLRAGWSDVPAQLQRPPSCGDPLPRWVITITQLLIIH